jgi:hypothetical protein
MFYLGKEVLELNLLENKHIIWGRQVRRAFCEFSVEHTVVEEELFILAYLLISFFSKRMLLIFLNIPKSQL